MDLSWICLVGFKMVDTASSADLVVSTRSNHRSASLASSYGASVLTSEKLVQEVSQHENVDADTYAPRGETPETLIGGKVNDGFLGGYRLLAVARFFEISIFPAEGVAPPVPHVVPPAKGTATGARTPRLVRLDFTFPLPTADFRGGTEAPST